MKKLWIGFLIVLCALPLGACGAWGAFGSSQTDYLRIHIRANSNGAADQAVKYDVRDAVVRYLTPMIGDCATFDAAVRAARGALDEIAAVADGVLSAQNQSYRSRARIGCEDFPSRTYDGMTLPKGRYTALIVELGTGAGDNWWCVAYPPLCFGGDEITVKSKIWEWIQSLR